MIQSLGDSQYRRKSPCDAFVRIVQRRIGGVMPSGLRLSIVVANQRLRDGAVAAFQPRDIAIQRQVLPMFVMSAMADHMPGVVQGGPGLPPHTRARRALMNRLHVVE